MKTYTILLMRPDYAAYQYGEDTYMTHIEADNVSTAQKKAQAEVWNLDVAGEDVDDVADRSGNPDDYAVLMVIEGKHMDIKET